MNSFSLLFSDTSCLFSNDYMFRSVGSSYDFSIPENNNSAFELLLGAILIGEFRFDFGFSEYSYEQFLDNKRN